MLLDPLYDAANVFGCARIFGISSEPIADIDAHMSVARKVMEYVGVDLFGAVGIAVQKSAAMHKDDCRALAVFISRFEQVDFLPCMGAVRDVASNGNAFLRRTLEDFAEMIEHDLDVRSRVAPPAWPKLRHQFAQLIGNFRKPG